MCAFPLSALYVCSSARDAQPKLPQVFARSYGHGVRYATCTRTYIIIMHCIMYMYVYVCTYKPSGRETVLVRCFIESLE